MAQFTEQTEIIEANLKALENAAKEADSMESYDLLIEANHKQKSNVENELKSYLNQLKLMAWPAQTMKKLLQKAENIQKGKNDAETKAK